MCDLYKLEVRSLYLDYSTPYDEVLLRHLLPLPNLKHLSIDPLDETYIAVLIRNIAKKYISSDPGSPGRVQSLIAIAHDQINVFAVRRYLHRR